MFPKHAQELQDNPWHTLYMLHLLVPLLLLLLLLLPHLACTGAGSVLALPLLLLPAASAACCSNCSSIQASLAAGSTIC
jgi:hypothetical protein